MKIAIVGPGPVGTAFGRRWAESGVEVLGFVGRDATRTGAAAALCAGRVLEFTDLAEADVVFVAVGDTELDGAMQQAAFHGAPRAGSLWIHASGFRELDVLQPAADAGASIGALHPLSPFPDADAGYNAMPGAIATVSAHPGVIGQLVDLARRCGLAPLELAPGVDRARYHAACAIAANGITATIDVATSLLAESMSTTDAQRCATTLALGAVKLCTAHGPRAALSGPVLRGDLETVKTHASRLLEPSALAVYRALMYRAAEMACARGAIDRGLRNKFEELLGG